MLWSRGLRSCYTLNWKFRKYLLIINGGVYSSTPSVCGLQFYIKIYGRTLRRVDRFLTAFKRSLNWLIKSFTMSLMVNSQNRNDSCPMNGVCAATIHATVYSARKDACVSVLHQRSAFEEDISNELTRILATNTPPPHHLIYSHTIEK